MTDFEEGEAIRAGKRLGISWTSWMGDWFTSHSPRNNNEIAEGQWDQWVSLALKVLQHPATEIVRPEAHAAVAGIDPKVFYSNADVTLTDDQVKALFGSEVVSS